MRRKGAKLKSKVMLDGKAMILVYDQYCTRRRDTLSLYVRHTLAKARLNRA